MIGTLKIVTGDASVSEHSMRRSGAQWFARKGVLLFVIQFLGRWGGITVARYVGNAYMDVAARATLTKAVQQVSSSSRGIEASAADVAVLAKPLADTTALEAVSSSVAKLEAVVDSWWGVANVKLTEAASRWQLSWTAKHETASACVVGFDKGAKVHAVLVGDTILPTSLRLEVWYRPPQEG